MIRFIACVFILCSIASSRLSVASTIYEEKIFDLPLEQILNHPNLKSTINDFLSKCDRGHNILFFKTSAIQNDKEVSHKYRCKQAHVIDKIIRYEEGIQNPSTVSEEDDSFTDIEIRSDADFSYADFFLDFEVTGKPVQIINLPLLFPESSLSLSSINDIVRSFQSPQQSGDFIFQNIDSITTLSTDDLKVPKYVMNDYFQRISMNDLGLSSPQLIIIGEGDIIKASDATCPSSLHGLYVILNDQEPNDTDVSMSRIMAKVFDPKSTATYLKPKLEIISNEEEKEISNFRINYQEDQIWHEKKNVKGYEHSGVKIVELSARSALFVPSKSAVTFQGEQNLASLAATLLLRFCFSNASNIQSVKSSLLFHTLLVNDGGNNPMSKDLLMQLNDPKFDHTMMRAIPSLSNYFDSYRVWPRNNNNEDTTTNNEIEENSIHRRVQQQEQQDHQKRKRRTKSKSFSSWQSEKTWNHKVLSLTLPILAPPDIISVGRNNVTLSWESSFHKKEGDVSNIGYIVMWEGTMANNKGMKMIGNCTFNEGDVDDNNSKKMMIEYVTDSASLSLGHHRIKRITALIEGFESNTEYNFYVSMAYGTDEINTHSPLSLKSKSIQTLKPQKPSSLSSPPYVILSSPTSNDISADEETSIVPTKASTILLEFLAPYDNGGMKILGYDVIKCNLDSYGHKVGEWILLQHGVEEINNDRAGVIGSVYTVQLAIHNLLPGGSYSFKVAARNNLGRSDWSSASEIIETKKLKSLPSNNDNEVQGRKLIGVKGTHARSNTNVNNNNMMIIHGIGSNSLNTPSNHKSLSTIIKLNDADQIMTIVGIADNIEIWSSYWSPKGFIVNAEACLVHQKLSSSIDDDDNVFDIITSDVEYRIAFIQRENYNSNNNKKKQGSSLVHRSLSLQRAGALAVVIIDDDGVDNTRCKYFDQYCMLGSSKEDGDNWGEYDLFRVWKDIKIPVVLVRTNISHGSPWKNILFDKKES